MLCFFISYDRCHGCSLIIYWTQVYSLQKCGSSACSISQSGFNGNLLSPDHALRIVETEQQAVAVTFDLFVFSQVVIGMIMELVVDHSPLGY